jgi:hypothetical protein
MLRAFFYCECARQSSWRPLELELLPSPFQCMLRTIVSDRRVHSNALILTEDLTNKVVAWAIEIASYAAQLPSNQAREDYLRERRRELVTGAQAEGATPRDAAIVADACVDAARRIMTELLALRAGAPQGRA